MKVNYFILCKRTELCCTFAALYFHSCAKPICRWKLQNAKMPALNLLNKQNIPTTINNKMHSNAQQQ